MTRTALIYVFSSNGFNLIDYTKTRLVFYDSERDATVEIVQLEVIYNELKEKRKLDVHAYIYIGEWLSESYEETLYRLNPEKEARAIFAACNKIANELLEKKREFYDYRMEGPDK